MNKISTLLKDPILRRFMSKIDVRGDDECWLWKGSKDTWGYGTFWLNGGARAAHKIAYFIRNGITSEFNKKSERLILRHTCNNPACCNPNHLIKGTDTDNLIDSVKSNRQVNKVKLYAGEIWLIRKLKVKLSNCSKYPRYKFSTRSVAKMFKVSQWTILNIWKREKYLCKEGYYI